MNLNRGIPTKDVDDYYPSPKGATPKLPIITIPPPRKQKSKHPDYFKRLSNKELMECVINQAKNKSYALELERRWMEFWILAQHKTSHHPDDLHEELTTLKTDIKYTRLEYNTSEQRLGQIRRKIKAEQDKLASVQQSDWHKMKRSVSGFKANAERLKNQVLMLQVEIRQLQETLATVTQEKAVLLRRSNLITESQHKLCEQNLTRIERDLRRLVLYEAGVLSK